MTDWGSYSKPDKKKEDVEVLRKPIKYTPLNDKDKFGLNIAIIGEMGFGKSLLAAMFGYFNSKYIQFLDKEKYPNTIRMLKEGHMPEVEKIKVLDLDNSFRKAASRGTFRDMVLPFKRQGILDVHNVSVPSRQQKIVNGEVVNDRVNELFRCKKEVEDAIEIATEDYGPEVLFIIDSLSSYYEVIDSQFSVVWEYINDAQMFEHVKQQKDWQIRNAWWNETMKKKRKYPGWQIDTVKAVEKPEQWKREGQSDFTIKWAESSGGNKFNLDQVYWIKRDGDGNAYFDVYQGAARYKSPVASENLGIYYPLYSQEAPFVFIEHMAPYIIDGGVEPWTIK